MFRIQRWFALLAGVILGFSLIVPAPRATGQVATPSADQIDMFRNLTPDQQDAILRQMGGGSSSGGLGGSTGLGSSSSSLGQLQQDRQRSGQGQGRSLVWALGDIFTGHNFLIAVIAACIGYLVVEFLRKRL